MLMRPLPEPARQKARGDVRIGFDAGPRGVRLAELYQAGSAKVMLPRSHSAETQAVLINTAGGLTGGDVYSYQATLGAKTRATIATQTAERAYRAGPGQGAAKVSTRLRVGAGARLDWLPQETILFEGAALSRRLEVDLAPDATFLCIEAVVLGRAAMGEVPEDLHFADRWRIRRAGRLIHAEALELIAPLSGLRDIAGLGTARALATVLFCGAAAGDLCDPLRAVLDRHTRLRAAASAWDGRLVLRIAAPDAQPLRAALAEILPLLRGAPLPRVWTM